MNVHFPGENVHDFMFKWHILSGIWDPQNMKVTDEYWHTHKFIHLLGPLSKEYFHISINSLNTVSERHSLYFWANREKKEQRDGRDGQLTEDICSFSIK